jgi:hypothetical protein
MTELLCVDPKRVAEFWPHVEPLLREAIIRTGISAWQDIEYNILYGDDLLWIGWDGEKVLFAGSTSLQQTDIGLVCVITACGGTDMHRWLPLISKIETYAKAEGCTRTRIVGRRGWMRVLEGYEMKNVILDKVI